MNLIGSAVIAFSMYSRIPMPKVAWTDERMRYAMCFFPAVGLVMLAIYLGFGRLGLGLSQTAYACLGTVLPLLVTGGIHMDGFLDVTDARSSLLPMEKKLEILKDPHAGAFAILGCGVYLLLYAGLFAELPGELLPVFGCFFVMTRALSGLSVVTFEKARKTGLAATFADKSQKRVTVAAMVFWLAVSFLLAADLNWRPACLGSAVSVVVFIYYRRLSVREFGGITGDLAGWFLQVCELAQLAALVLWSWCG